MSRRRIAQALAVALAASLGAAAWLVARPSPPRMMIVGGHATPCHCTQRIEP